MSKLAPGDYVIYNRVLSCSGQKLAVTFNGKDKPATVTPLTHSSEQIWCIKDFTDGRTQTVVPRKSGDLQVAIGKNVAVTIEAGQYVWFIRRGNKGFCIETGDRDRNWGIEEGNVDEKICVSKDKGHHGYKWVIERVR
ncbi:hypothetical protein TWF506_008830 [Arthrobotrys conoides]|uniref:CCL2-like lectin domain-containing protein n=1 Tax=Arthrobotrys conoides TaxID=74498 RepID=A0AAN8N6N8_9PEZI